MIGDPAAHLKFNHLAASVRHVILERAVQDVRRLLVVIEHKLAAHGGNPVRKPDAQPPPRNIELVNALVAEIAASEVPEPVPVVMKTVFRERLEGAGPSLRA